ncbi:MAG: Cryptochrome, partial [Pseudomonadota bacterium]
MTPSTEKNGVIYWFRNDLRLHDQPALQKAIETAQQQQTWLLPVYIHDTALLDKTAWGFERTSPQRNAWTAMALRDLSRQLTEFGSQLLQMKGDPVECLKALCQVLQPA